jgi:CRISPR-associated protein Csm4
MPRLDIYRLTFRDGLHIGRHGIGQENVLAHIPSDTLFAALTSVRVYWRGDADQWIARFKSRPALRLTSAFPYAGGVRFYPRPFIVPRIKASNAGEMHRIAPKNWRKIQFVSEGILKHLLIGEIPESLLLPERNEEPREGISLQNGSLWLTKEERDKLPKSMTTKKIKNQVENLTLKAIQRRNVWVEMTIPRVRVDRVSNTSEIFHTGRIQFAEGCGLWFGIQWEDKTLRPEVEEMLHILGDSGLGAERSVGYGAFKFQREEMEQTWNDPKASGQLYLLSRYYPVDQADTTSLLDETAAYDLVYVAGRVQTPGAANQRRRGVHLVAEGSIVGGSAVGGLATVTPIGAFPHDVYRYGFALGVGMEVRHG